MNAVRSRVLYWSTVAGLLIMLFFFSKRYLFYMAAAMVVFAVAMAVMLKMDSRRISVFLDVQPSHHGDPDLVLSFTVHCTDVPLAAKYMLIEVEMINTFLGTVEERVITMPMRRRALKFEASLPIVACGETVIRCKSVRICDLLELFGIRLEPFAETRTTVYPRRRNLQLALARSAVGSSRMGGALQNKRGNDPSEIFDIREYAPGDDIRSIHWKLSGKLDELYIKQPSDPSHYDIALMPDLGKKCDGEDVFVVDLNAAVSVTISIGEQLLQNGVMFCMLVPSNGTLVLRGVRNANELSHAIQNWLSAEIPDDSDTGLKLFITEQMQAQFSRLFIVSAKSLSSRLMTLSADISTVAVCTCDTDAPTYTTLSRACESATVPSSADYGGEIRIVC